MWFVFVQREEGWKGGMKVAGRQGRRTGGRKEEGRGRERRKREGQGEEKRNECKAKSKELGAD